MSTAAAIYARFSTDKQSETSIDDQARICRSRAEALGVTAIRVFSDAGISGSTLVADRPGAAAMQAAALAGAFGILIIEGLDRLSRDQVEQETVVRRLEHRGLRIIGVADGYDTESGDGRKLLRGVRGMINETYLDDLRKKTHRGLAGQLGRGFHAGGLSYGYRSVVAGVNPRGEPIGHRLEVEESHAEIVREIFAHYGAGHSCQRIAADLNARGVPGPRRRRDCSVGTWSVSALYGSPAKGSGILNNELYIGRYVWNRSRWTKNPDTKQRERAMRPRSEWIIEERPGLRIVDPDAWESVRVRMGSARAEGGWKGRARPPGTLLGGLLRCGSCGGAMVAVSASSYGCAARKDRGLAVCRGVTAPRRDTEVRILGSLRESLLAPAAVADVLDRVRTAIADTQRGAGEADRQRTTRRRTVEAEVGRLTDAVAAMGLSPALRGRLETAERELATLETPAGPAHREPPPAAAIEKALRAQVLALREQLEGDILAAREALRQVLGPIAILNDGEGRVIAEMETRLQRVLLASGDASLSRVAGAGFEPATFGL